MLALHSTYHRPQIAAQKLRFARLGGGRCSIEAGTPRGKFLDYSARREGEPDTGRIRISNLSVSPSPDAKVLVVRAGGTPAADCAGRPLSGLRSRGLPSKSRLVQRFDA